MLACSLSSTCPARSCGVVYNYKLHAALWKDCGFKLRSVGLAIVERMIELFVRGAR